MKGFIVATLLIVIVYLLLENSDTFSSAITTVTGVFGKSFSAVTTVGSNWGKQ